MFLSSQDKTVNGDNIKNVSYKAHKYNKAIIEEIAQVWEKDSSKTVSEALTILEAQYPEVKEINVKSFATLFSRLQLRHRDTFLSNIDKEIIDYITGLLTRDPSLTSTQINKIFCEKFPNKLEFSTLRINQIITLLNLRSLKGIDDNVDRETAQEIVQMFTYNKCLKLEEAQKHLSIRFPMKPILSLEIIDQIVKLNYCQISDEQDVFRVDQDVLKEINKLISNGQKSKEIIYEKIKKKFPHKEIITLPYIEFLVKKYNLLKKHSIVVKCDEEMKITICKLYKDNPEFSASKINEQLRNLLPNKPLLSRHTISNKIRQFRFANQL